MRKYSFRRLTQMKLPLFTALLIPLIAQAQVYKCTQNGQTVYAERPCSTTAKLLEIDTSVSQERRQQAADVAERERALGKQVDNKNRAEQRQVDSRAADFQAQNDAKKTRCAQLLRDAKGAKDESNMWRYHQGLIDDAKRRQKEAEDAHFTECYSAGIR
jgi:hypothetical protein